MGDFLGVTDDSRLALLDGADLPYPGLSVKDFGKGPVITLNGIPWSDCSGSEQLIVAAAIAFAIKPECKFALMDKFEQFDLKSLNKFDKWLCEHDRQVIATRVSTGSECSFIIEDGYVVGQEGLVIDKTPLKAAKDAIKTMAGVDAPVKSDTVVEGVREIVSSEVGGGKRVIVDTTPSAAMSKAMELLARKRQSIMAKASSATPQA